MADITIPREAKEAANKIEYLMRLHDDMSDTIEALRAEVETLKAARDLVLEEAAKVCEQVSTDVWTELGGIDAKGWMKATAKDCANAIRALKSGIGDTL